MSDDIYKDQWEYEKKLFFKALENNSFHVLENSIFAYYPGTENTNDPRTISYTYGENRLEDAHFCVQHCALSHKELNTIFNTLSRIGVDVEQYDIFYECTGIFSL